MSKLVRIFRLLLSIFIVVISINFVTENFSTAFDNNPQFVVVTSFINIWAMFGLFGVGICATVMSIVTSGSWRESKNNNLYVGAILVSALIISPIISGALFYKLKSTANGFVECTTLSQSSKRYSSNTYAISMDECHKIVNVLN